MRHGIAADFGEGGILKDEDRPLTPEGRARMKQAAAGLKELDLKFNVILTSPLLRCRQTAEAVAEVLDLQHRVKIMDSLAPGRAFATGEGGCVLCTDMPTMERIRRSLNFGFSGSRLSTRCAPAGKSKK